MFSRTINKDVLARYESYKQRNRININLAHDALRNCFRFIRRGQSCALIVSDMQSVRVVMDILNNNKYLNNLIILSKKEDGFIFGNNVELRILPKNIESLAHIMIGKNVKIIQASDGDPKMKKFKKVMEVF